MSSTPKCLAIIGTAGRKDDAAKLSLASYEKMLTIALAVMRKTGCTDIVSGGAAWADHVAVGLVTDSHIEAKNLRLHLPAPYVAGQFSEAEKDGGISNYYHHLFKARSKIPSLEQIGTVIAQGAQITSIAGGFFARNRLVAADGNVVLAFTFGSGEPWLPRVFANVKASQAGLKDGGTAHTFDASQASVKIHCCLAPL